MLQQATDTMKKMSPEDLDRMMKNAPLPPGVDAETMKSRMDAISKNPDMLMTAVNRLKSMPEDQRKKLLETQKAMAGGGAGGMPSGTDLSSMAKAFEDPNMMKQVAEMAKSMGVDSSADPGEAEMMRKAAESLSANPELGAQMSNMLKSMPPDQLQKMMEMSSKMKSKKDAGGGAGCMDAASMDDVMGYPDMMKVAEDMMANMSPETLMAMASSSGIELDEGKAKMIGKLMPLLPYVMKTMHFFGKVKKGVKALFSPRGRIVIAVVVMLAARARHIKSVSQV